MEKIIITEFSRIIEIKEIQKVIKEPIMIDDDTIIPYALFAVLANGEFVNIGNFTDVHESEFMSIFLDIFSSDEKDVFNVGCEINGMRDLLKELKHVTGEYYEIAVRDLKNSILSGEIHVSFS